MRGTDNLVAFLREILAPYFLAQDTWQASGTWTPGLAGATTAGVFVFSTQAGRYHRHGSLVTARARLVVSSITTPPAGGLRLTGLPFPVFNANAVGDGYISLLSNYNYSVGALELTLVPAANQTYALFFETFDNAATGAAPAAAATATFSLSCTIIYEAG